MSTNRKAVLVWRPRFGSPVRRAISCDDGMFAIVFRNASSEYISRPAVRLAVMKRCDFACIKCGSDIELQIDHIIPVWSATRTNFKHINTIDNLQVLCKKHNSEKRNKIYEQTSY